MKAVGYIYEEGVHCIVCAQKRFSKRLKFLPKDRDGKQISPIYENEELNNAYCMDCLNSLNNENEYEFEYIDNKEEFIKDKSFKEF